jgi:hypothetical protein
MPKVLSKWSRVHTKTYSGALAHYKETITYGSGALTDTFFSPFGPLISSSSKTDNVPNPPPGVNWTVMFIQNDTMSVDGDICLQGAEKVGGTYGLLYDNLVQYSANTTSTPQATTGYYVQQNNATPTGGVLPVMRFFQDSDGLHSTSKGRDKTAEVHIFWQIP